MVATASSLTAVAIAMSASTLLGPAASATTSLSNGPCHNLVTTGWSSRRESRELAERGQNVVGPDSRRHLLNNHSNYRTRASRVRSDMPARTRITIITATARLTSHVEADHGCPGIELTHPLAGKSFHQHRRRCQEGLRGQAGGRCRHSRQEHLPLGGFEAANQQPCLPPRQRRSRQSRPAGLRPAIDRGRRARSDG